MDLSSRSAWLIILSTGILTGVMAFGLNMAYPDWRFIHYPVHAFIEGVGAFAAITVAVLILNLRTYRHLPTAFTWVAVSLIGMGLLDGMHAMLHASSNFVWLHSIATLFGGTLISFVWISDRLSALKIDSYLVISAVGIPGMIIVISVLLPSTVPVMIVEEHFSPFAILINIVGGAGFLIAAAYFLSPSVSKESVGASILISLLCVLFGISSIVFVYSMLWDAAWWFWHIMRAIAYLMVIVFYSTRSRKIQHELYLLKRELEARVSERTHELMEANEELDNSKEAYRAILETSKDWIWSINLQGQHTYSNQAVKNILGYSEEELMSSGTIDLIHMEDREYVKESLSSCIQKQEGWSSLVIRWRHKDGSYRYLESNAVPEINARGGLVGFRGVDRDITERKIQEEQIVHQAHYDTLTDLPNRFLSMDRLSQLINEANRNQDLVAVLFLDLDDFKKINDTLGHDTGDKLLQEAALRLRDGVRRGDTVGRLGGDEFIVLLGGINDASDVRPIAETLIAKFRDAYKVDGRVLVLTASIGISIYPSDGKNPSELLRNADSAMYYSKDQGRNTYSYYTDEMNQGVARRLLIEEQMRGALDRGEFKVHYQPKVELESGIIIGVEALLRWNNPALGEIPPVEFIPIAEHTGMIVPIGQYVLSEALGMAAKWRADLGISVTMAVNLSPRQFRDPNLISFIQQSIDQSGISKNLLELEITEGVLMSGHAYIDDALDSLNKLGVSIAMDDFGTGYSSLSYLRSYPFDVVKIDREFINEITVVPSDLELVTAAIAMAHGLGLKVVAEGVETKDQQELLSAHGCDYGQGYLFSKPVSPEEIAELLKNQAVSKEIGTGVSNII
ncbi:MAG: EAL domain-containing protein [Candidatus Sedimenticola sp. 6PFRAG5]